MTERLAADRPAEGGAEAAPPRRLGHPEPYVSVIVPAWNGAERLSNTLFTLHSLLASQHYPTELIVVDDCSGPDTVRAIGHFSTAVAGDRTPVRVLRNEQNQGKGYSVARGMLAARGGIRLFTDADLAYPAEEIESIIDALERGSDVAIACRVLRESRYVMSPTFFPYLFTRHLLSRAYNAVVRALLIEAVLDTQAGLKGFTRAAAELIFSRLTIPRFGFDVECLYIAQRHGQRITQVPVTFQYDDEPTTVNFVRDGARMLTDLGHIVMNAWRGRYN